jgi:thioredoxin 1
MIQESNQQELAALIGKGTFLVDFSTSWCGPCRALLPVLKRLAGEGINVITIDAESNRELSDRLDVRAFPTVIAFRDGREIKRLVGLTSREKLLALLAA